MAESPTPFTLAETARRLGAYRWIELRLFEVIGGWVTTVPELEVKLTLATLGSHHAWRAERWLERLPVTAELTVDGLTAPATPAVAALLEEVARPAEPGLTIEKLVGVYRVVLPRLIAAYGFHLTRTATVADAPVIRALRFALGDEMEDWRAGEALLQSVISCEGDARRAASRQAELEVLAVRAGGIAGPGSIGGPGAVDPPVESPDPASP